MGLVTKPYIFSPNTVIYSAQVNANFDTLYNLVNGNIDTNNIAANAGITASQLADPVNGIGEIIMGIGKRFQQPYDGSVITGTDKSQVIWGDGTGGYARIIQIGNDFVITKNLRWDGTNYYRDDTTKYGYAMKLIANTTTNNAIDFYMVVPGANPVTSFLHYTSFRPDPVTVNAIELLLGADKNGAQAQTLELIKWDGSGLANLTCNDISGANISASGNVNATGSIIGNNTAGQNIRFGAGYTSADALNTRVMGIVSSITYVSTGRYKYNLNATYSNIIAVASLNIGISQQNIGVLYPTLPANYIETIITSDAGANTNLSNSAIILAIP